MPTPTPLTLHDDRLFPADHGTRAIARRLYGQIAALPIISPHGHTDPAWFATDAPFANATELLLVPDHYVFRMLYSQGISLDALGFRVRMGRARRWIRARRGASSLSTIVCCAVRLLRCGSTMSSMTCSIYASGWMPVLPIITTTTSPRPCRRLRYRPRALFERFNIEVIATTESPLDTLQHHAAIRDSGWKGRVLTAYRPDPVVDPNTNSSPTRCSSSAPLPAKMC